MFSTFANVLLVTKQNRNLNVIRESNKKCHIVYNSLGKITK